MRFTLKGIKHDGRVEYIDLQAPDESGARAQALELGYAILRLSGHAELSSLMRPRSRRFPVLLFSQELLVLLDAGLPLLVAVETLAQNERHASARTLLNGLAATMRQGRTLSAALEHYSGTFSTLFVATVRASERTSDLGPTLSRYITYQNQIDTIRTRLINASIYPALLLFAGGLVSLFLLFYVVPRFGKIYEDRSTELPGASKLLLHWGQAVEGHAMLVSGAVAVLIVAFFYVLRMPLVRARIEALLWRLPVVGEHMKVYQLARFYRTIGMLLRGGLPLVAALDMGADLLHPVLRKRLTRANLAIREGLSVSASMESNGLTTPVALRLLAVGEQSGDMGEMMDRIARFHDEEISRWVDWFTRLFEPILMGVIGVVIGAIVILMYMPIFELAGSMR